VRRRMTASRSSRPAPTPSSARASRRSRPIIPIAQALPAVREGASFIAECKRGGTTAAELETAEKKGFDTGLSVDHPLDPGVAAPALHRQFRADGLWRGAFSAARPTTSATLNSRANTGSRSRASLRPRRRKAPIDRRGSLYSPGRLVNSSFLDGSHRGGTVSAKSPPAPKRRAGAEAPPYGDCGTGRVAPSVTGGRRSR
jgi:hypothetical protein